MRWIWLIGGTQESAQLAIGLAEAGLPCRITVTTPNARSLYPDFPLLQVLVAQLSAEQLPAWLETHQISAVLDASHPFAAEISQQAIAAATQAHIPYLRYERPRVPDLNSDAVIELDHWTALWQGDFLQNQRVLLTIGYRWLPHFRDWQTQATLFARILPSPIALQTALEAGFTPDRLIALRPPISLDLEKALWQQWQISTVVTKASGVAGGEAVKRAVAAELGVKLITIARPDLEYPQQTNDPEHAVQFCRQALAVRFT